MAQVMAGQEMNGHDSKKYVELLFFSLIIDINPLLLLSFFDILSATPRYFFCCFKLRESGNIKCTLILDFTHS
jgi:hypothetical protein